MIVKFIMIVGLPGSGKTTFAHNNYGNVENHIIFDDFSINPRKHINDYNREKPSTVVIPDPNLCGVSREVAERKIKEMFGIDDICFEWIYFENNPEQCKINAIERNDNRNVFVDIDSLSRRYVIPEGSKKLPVFKKLLTDL